MLSRKPRLIVFDFSEPEGSPISGHTMAIQLATALANSGRFVILGRAVWCPDLQNIELAKEFRSHRPWAVNTGSSAGADAVVVGAIREQRRGKRITSVSLLDSFAGNVIVEISHPTVSGLVKRLTHTRIVSSIPLKAHAFVAQVSGVCNSNIVATIRDGSAFRPADLVRVELVLENVPDPFDPVTSLDRISAYIGEAKVLSAGDQLLLLDYQGTQKLKVGDSVVLFRL